MRLKFSSKKIGDPIPNVTFDPDGFWLTTKGAGSEDPSTRKGRGQGVAVDDFHDIEIEKYQTHKHEDEGRPQVETQVDDDSAAYVHGRQWLFLQDGHKRPGTETEIYKQTWKGSPKKLIKVDTTTIKTYVD